MSIETCLLKAVSWALLSISCPSLQATVLVEGWNTKPWRLQMQMKGLWKAPSKPPSVRRLQICDYKHQASLPLLRPCTRPLPPSVLIRGHAPDRECGCWLTPSKRDEVDHHSRWSTFVTEAKGLWQVLRLFTSFSLCKRATSTGAKWKNQIPQQSPFMSPFRARELW